MRTARQFALGTVRRVVPFPVPPLALLLFVAQVFVQLAKVVIHLAQAALYVLQVTPHLTQAFPPLVLVGALLWLSPTITAPRHETSSLPESALKERVDARNVPDEVQGGHRGGGGRRWRCSSPVPRYHGCARSRSLVAGLARAAARSP